MDGVSVFSDHICELGEGPSYDPATDTLFWFDIVNGKLLEKPLAGALKVHDLGVMASAIAVIDADRQLIATEIGLQVRDVKTGRLTLHTPIEADNPVTRSNDSRVHPCGALWTGTMGKGEEKARARSTGSSRANCAGCFPASPSRTRSVFPRTARLPTTPTQRPGC